MLRPLSNSEISAASSVVVHASPELLNLLFLFLRTGSILFITKPRSLMMGRISAMKASTPMLSMICFMSGWIILPKNHSEDTFMIYYKTEIINKKNRHKRRFFQLTCYFFRYQRSFHYLFVVSCKRDFRFLTVDQWLFLLVAEQGIALLFQQSNKH